ncbi:RsmB/NOP family class I SAM-dependent RNA methyltransferase [Taibaiella soli]|uniref:RsmB/NOP family class I SAM-dependent RNA methyltransferase n=1 Tax=Taibaiella soli TaxID=1649169 RepID=A0A2W2AWS7_9BACT|nr:RsmB/NOP family class I SAM-dependent RNA methyltransferase [Taibaiella soli]PZF72434.1 RsmB/NOP family class I SAM-dependent RNA methyltransferase [Taibaiella soli]
MRYIWQHIEALLQYDGRLPLTHYLKNYFRQYPKLGSRDRKLLSAMVYSYYRCRKALVMPDANLEEVIRVALFLCNNPEKHTAAFLPSFPEAILSAPVEEKMQFLKERGIELNIPAIFPQQLPLSEGIKNEAWLLSMWHQPQLFIRIRKEKSAVVKKLTAENIAFSFVNDHCVALHNGTSVDKILPADWYVVQDASSQQTGSFFQPKKKENWYDCCSGAGGKSLLLKDLEPSVTITVSDVRDSILHNLRLRFNQYGYSAPKSYTLDVSDASQLKLQLGSQQFDNIIADVPCSGSGTWARTPEQLYFFDPEFVTEISKRQTTILHNIADKVKPGGKIFYITCSVFKAENENVVAAAIKDTSLEIESMQIINGLTNQADSMFIAVLKRIV